MPIFSQRPHHFHLSGGYQFYSSLSSCILFKLAATASSLKQHVESTLVSLFLRVIFAVLFPA